MQKDWLSIEKRVYIVTGGSSGIGKAITKALLDRGAVVVNADINDTLESRLNSNYFFCKTDITSWKQLENLVATTLKKFGKIDGLINNAGINIPRLLVGKVSNDRCEITEAVFKELVAVNMWGSVGLTQLVAKNLIQAKSGVIINMSSESGLEGSEGQSLYAATKAALYSYTRSWAKELGKYNVRVVGVAPGILEETGLRTPDYEESLAYTRGMTVEQLRENYEKIGTIPLGRSGKLEEVADLVIFLLSDRASYITGTTVNIAGGKTRG